MLGARDTKINTMWFMTSGESQVNEEVGKGNK